MIAIVISIKALLFLFAGILRLSVLGAFVVRLFFVAENYRRIKHQLVNIAPTPIFAGLERLDDRVTYSMTNKCRTAGGRGCVKTQALSAKGAKCESLGQRPRVEATDALER